MTYDVRQREAAICFIKDGGSKTEAARIFKVSRDTIYRWLNLKTLAPAPRPKSHKSKLDKVALRAHVKDHPDMYLRERAAVFGVHLSTMGHALKKLGFVKKNGVYILSDVI